jgi:hypothetical protein
MASPSPYRDGALAFLAGVLETANPYPADSADHVSWMDGWQDEKMLLEEGY